MANEKRVTLREIAEKAGLSRAAVSLALKQHPSISASTLKRVAKIAAQLGYRPDPEISKLMAHTSSLRSKQQHSTLAWLTAWDTEDGALFWLRDRRIFRGATERAEALGYKLEPFWLKAPGMTARRTCSILQTRGIEGVVVSSLPDGIQTLDFKWEQFSVTAIGFSLKKPLLNSVDAAHFENLSLALAKIRKRKYKRVGLIESSGTDMRMAHSWTGAFLVDQLAQPEANRVPLLLQNEVTQEDFVQWFRRHQPEVVISNELPIIQWLNEMGLKLPEDVAHVRLDNMDPKRVHLYDWGFSGTWTPGIDQLPELIGSAAVDMVVAQIHRQEKGVPLYQKMMLIKGEWREGETIRKKRRA